MKNNQSFPGFLQQHILKVLPFRLSQSDSIFSKTGLISLILFYNILLSNTILYSQSTNESQYIKKILPGSHVLINWANRSVGYGFTCWDDVHFCPSGKLVIYQRKETITNAYYDFITEYFTYHGSWKLETLGSGVVLTYIWSDGTTTKNKLVVYNNGVIGYANTGITLAPKGYAECY